MLTAKDIETEIQARYDTCKFRVQCLKDEVKIRQIKHEEIVLCGLLNWIRKTAAEKAATKNHVIADYGVLPP